MTPLELAQALAQILAANFAARGGDAAEIVVSEQDTQLERPKSREHGEWASNVAMKFAKRIGTNPRELAQELAAEIEKIDGVAKVEIAGPGFMNITLDAASAGETARRVVEQGADYGRNDSLAGQRINLEFVSANPTGPLHMGHTRWAALGDSTARVLRAAGAEVTNEYYINDAGSQMNKFGRSVLAAVLGEEAPEDAYPGEYIQVLGAKVREQLPNVAELAASDRDAALEQVQELAYQLQLAEIKDSLERFNVHFDVFFSERTLHAKGANGEPSPIELAVDRLREQGHVFEEDGAIWVRTTAFGDDKDRVFTRGNGIYTYFAADAAYYLDKMDRGFTEKIYLLGADHHGYIGRLTAIAGAAGDDVEKSITVLIGQLVNLNGARLSKRAGNIIELDDLLEWLGSDTLRYWLARYPADSPLSLDGEKIRSRTNDNPVFYVQYAHARTCAVDRNAAAAGITREVFAPELLTHDTETDLLGKLQQYPGIVAGAAELREPHRIARFLEELAAVYHRWYDNCRVIPLGEEPVEDVHRTRLWLNDAAGQVLRNGLDLLGVSAPERL
ncbi:arginine--tRNA ligase [Leucobacter aridicollis]|uniref:Arginine--tRNA ligase n=1 Tax=Leucobacter aridicollis TaxID=283878 RepID=A0A852R7Y8_9MICO|nr:arginine--tRNA ligase [Leucobacter aridicollis]MBL3681435.1 arginine--tRNA ligase [Leucobacter aridicollis]NYD27535.1 arginyl-tRNA synthetase [Leucobacter aridicollis]